MKTRSDRQKISRRQFLQVAAGTGVLLTLSGCAPGAPPIAPAQGAAPAADVPQRGGILRVIFSDDISTLDPSISLSVSDIQLGYALYSSLTRRSEGEAGVPIYPELAESWEVNADATIHTFHLRQGVTFSHGTPFTAADVEYTVNRLLDPALGSTAGAPLHAIEQMEIVDDHTIRFHLKSPSVTLPYTLGGSSMGIVPHDRTTEQLAVEATGSGPFVLAERIVGERTLLKRNANYWDTERPYLDEVQLLFIPDPTAQAGALTSGTADLLHQIGLENVSILEGAAGVTVRESTQGVYPILVMHTAEKPFDDVRVRQALKHTVDRAALHTALMQGRGSIGNDQPVGPGTPFWAAVPPLAYDVEKAKQLLADAGYANGLEVTLSTSDVGGPRVNDAVVAIQEMAKAAGIVITIDKVPPGTYWAQTYMQVPFFTSWWPIFSDPDGTLPLAYSSQGDYNESGWSDPQVDALIVKAQGELDVAKRKQLYAEVQQTISAEGGVLIPYFVPYLQASRSNVRGHIPGPRMVFQNIWLAPS